MATRECILWNTYSKYRVKIEVWLADHASIQEDTIRAIVVPFSVGSSGTVAVQSVIDRPGSSLVSIPEGNYALVFEAGVRAEYRQDPAYQGRKAALLPSWCRLTFIPQESVQPEILRADERLSPTYPLLMAAEPA
ncbi:hypothetical protein HJG54_34260 [Leptolyngbya sp. NK1-12]|uniref:Uncharacterized protein n=1 Tax=Leptolyngbya sp. NK1-12 TaxID=2547451 RepID=A0AA97ANK2_9CYAN|nr:hypothetical protein HJG54_28640 [Leptolyngbya sp. NK1-12]WNZ27890.1 hypothetical protein HJG54_34260 [Leptolyngbya sp. NK1-12]